MSTGAALIVSVIVATILYSAAKVLIGLVLPTRGNRVGPTLLLAVVMLVVLVMIGVATGVIPTAPPAFGGHP